MAYEARDIKGKDYWMKMKDLALFKHSNGNPLTLEETAFAIWNPDVDEHPMTSMGILKIEKKALDKLKSKLKKYRISNLDDVFESKFREFGRPISAAYDV